VCAADTKDLIAWCAQVNMRPIGGATARHNPGALGSRAFIYLKLRRYDAAVADYTVKLRTNPDDAYALFGRGVAKYMKGDLRGGDGDIVASQALKPDISEDMARLGIRLQSPR
jgi:tetratricopeptide (TPR) repeat protein